MVAELGNKALKKYLLKILKMSRGTEYKRPHIANEKFIKLIFSSEHLLFEVGPLKKDALLFVQVSQIYGDQKVILITIIVFNDNQHKREIHI